MSKRNNVLIGLFCTTFVLLASCSSVHTVHNTTSYCNYQEIMNSEGNKYIDLSRMQAILNFVENFRTAYNRKDIELLAKVYADDALIVTKGKKMQTKKEYIDYLRSTFKKNPKINIAFDSIEAIQCPKYPDIYGVGLLQGWNTSKYSNVGSLFLIIDFKDGENMQIHQRIWQSENLNDKPISEEEKFKLRDFDVRGK